MKTPGQKAYELARKLDEATGPSWDDMDKEYREKWERIAAAVTAPELPSYGRVMRDARVVAYTAGNGRDGSDNIAALAVIAEAKRRGDL